MPTRHEAALGALFVRLEGVSGPKVLRNAELPQTVPAEGLIILRDGVIGEPEDVTLSPVSYAWRHRTELEVFVRGEDPASRSARLDELISAVEQIIAADRTLGGVVDHCEAGPPEEVEDLAQEGARSFRAAIAPVILHYTSDASVA